MRLQNYINEFVDHKASANHETSIAKAFSGKIVPSYDQWPKSIQWIRKIGIEPGMKVISSNRTHPNPIKPDVVVKFIGEDRKEATFGISAKMENYGFIQNWANIKTLIDIFDEDIADYIIKDSIEYIEKRSTGKAALIGLSFSFGRGNSSGSYKKLLDIKGINISSIRKMISGTTNEKWDTVDGEKYANCFYRKNNVPNDIVKLFEILEPMDSDVIKEEAGNINVIYRAIFYTSHTQMSKIDLAIVPEPKRKDRNEPTKPIYSWEAMKNLVYWKPNRSSSIVNGYKVVEYLKKYNIIIANQLSSKEPFKKPLNKKPPTTPTKPGTYFYSAGKRTEYNKDYLKAKSLD